MLKLADLGYYGPKNIVNLPVISYRPHTYKEQTLQEPIALMYSFMPYK